MALISFYRNAFDKNSTETIALDLFLDAIKKGRWQDIVMAIRVIQDKKARQEAKAKVPNATISGAFKKREDASLEKHSGFLPMDLDDVEDFQKLRDQLAADKYVYSFFTSISGYGLCVIFKINPSKHRESFEGISEYLFKKYGVICDPSSKNVSRTRYVSYDPDLYFNTHAEKFVEYPKSKPPKKVDQVVYIKDDFTRIINKIIESRINLCEDYHTWLRIGFALCHQFGEEGRSYFHIVSQYSSKYEPAQADKQYDAMLRHKSNNEVTLATFYYYCKNAGIEIYSPQSKKIIQAAKQGKASGLKPEQILKNLNRFEGIETDEKTIEQINESNNLPKDELDIVTQMEMFIRANYNLKRNKISMKIEMDGKELEEEDLNSMYVALLKAVPKVNYQLFNILVQSNFLPSYNPFFEFISKYADRNSTGNLSKVFRSIQTQDVDYAEYFLTKWMVAMMASIHGEHCPLMPIFSGPEQGRGKTEFWRRLLPSELQCYYAEISPGIKDTDFQILLCQKLIVLDDECGSKSARDEVQQKAILSKQQFDLRKPYGRGNITLQRLALLCGTTNMRDILNDPTGNRRYPVIDFKGYDFEAYNSVDKIDLFMEAYRLYKDGFDYQINRKDIEYMNTYKDFFTKTDAANQLINKYFTPADSDFGKPMTATDIKVYIEKESNQRLSLTRIGLELKNLGFEQNRNRIYYVLEKGLNGAAASASDYETDLPF